MKKNSKKKAVTKKAVTKKAVTKKAAAKKAAAKKAAAKKAAAKKAAAKKAAAKKAAAKKAAAKKAAAKKAAAKKAAAKKAAAKKAAAKKAATKKAAETGMISRGGAATASATGTGVIISVKPKTAFQGSSRDDKLTKLTVLQEGCLDKATEMRVKIGRDVTVNVTDTESGKISVADSDFTFLQLSITECNVVGKTRLPGFDAQAVVLAKTLADLGVSNGVWT